jgi:hypothetical protein
MNVVKLATFVNKNKNQLTHIFSLTKKFLFEMKISISNLFFPFLFPTDEYSLGSGELKLTDLKRSSITAASQTAETEIEDDEEPNNLSSFSSYGKKIVFLFILEDLEMKNVTFCNPLT